MSLSTLTYTVSARKKQIFHGFQTSSCDGASFGAQFCHSFVEVIVESDDNRPLI